MRFHFHGFQTRRQEEEKRNHPESGRGPFCWLRALWALGIYLFFKSLTHESVGWLGGKKEPTIKEIADERHATVAVPGRHSRLLKVSCAPLAEPTRAGVPRLALQDQMPSAFELLQQLPHHHCSPPVHVCCNYTVSKGEAQRLVDFGWGSARQAGVTWALAECGKAAGRPGEDVTSWSKC